MRLLFLPFFILKLLLLQIPFLSSTLFLVISPYRTTLTLVFIFFLYLVLVNNSVNSEQKSQLTNQEKSQFPGAPSQINKLESSNLIEVNLTQEELETIKENLLKIKEQQPLHRDVLLNLSLVEYYLENLEENKNYWQQAKQLDPNYAVFLEN